jgi:hypothetical protein
VAQRVDENRGALDPVLVPPNVACACVRSFAAKTCGGFREGTDCTPKCERPDGVRMCAGGKASLSECREDADCGFPAGRCGQVCDPTLGDAQCPAGFSCKAQDAVCAAEGKTCEFVHGPGIAASGIVACGASTGLRDIDYLESRDSIAQQATTTFSGGPVERGAAFVLTSTAIGTLPQATCEPDPFNPNKGPDTVPCTDDDPEKGLLNTIFLTTGTSKGEVTNANNIPDARIGEGEFCGAALCEVSATGSAVQCTDQGFDFPGAAVVSTFTSEDLDPLGDVVVTTKFAAEE